MPCVKVATLICNNDDWSGVRLYPRSFRDLLLGGEGLLSAVDHNPPSAEDGNNQLKHGRKHGRRRKKVRLGAPLPGFFEAPASFTYVLFLPLAHVRGCLPAVDLWSSVGIWKKKNQRRKSFVKLGRKGCTIGAHRRKKRFLRGLSAAIRKSRRPCISFPTPQPTLPFFESEKTGRMASPISSASRTCGHAPPSCDVPEDALRVLPQRRPRSAPNRPSKRVCTQRRRHLSLRFARKPVSSLRVDFAH